MACRPLSGIKVAHVVETPSCAVCQGYRERSGRIRTSRPTGSEILRVICNQIERKVGHEMETGSLTGAYICICICNTGLRTIMED